MHDKKPAYLYLRRAMHVFERVVPVRRTRLRALNFLRHNLEGREPDDAPAETPRDTSPQDRKPGSRDFDA